MKTININETAQEIKIESIKTTSFWQKASNAYTRIGMFVGRLINVCISITVNLLIIFTLLMMFLSIITVFPEEWANCVSFLNGIIENVQTTFADMIAMLKNSVAWLFG